MILTLKLVKFSGGFKLRIDNKTVKGHQAIPSKLLLMIFPPWLEIYLQALVLE